MNDFFKMIKIYLVEYLPCQRCLSDNTIISYRQTLNLFVSYLRDICGIAVKEIDFDILTKEVFLDFLDWLEAIRGCSISTRNQRLMALRAFFNFAGNNNCAYISLALSLSNIPVKNGCTKTVGFLSETALKTLLEQPNPAKPTDVRNQFFMILMYDTAARCSELINLRIRDLRLDNPHPVVYLHGKGNKIRSVPILKRTVKYFEHYMKLFHPNEKKDSDQFLFYTTIHERRNPISTDTVARFFNIYAKKAHEKCAETPEHIHPHMLRHTRAMHLYRNGMPMMLLSEFLGHANVETTMIYAYADTEMKRIAIEKANIIHSNCELPNISLNDDDMILKLAGLC